LWNSSKETATSQSEKVDLGAGFYRLLKEISTGRIGNSAYDTAWVARLSALGEPIGDKALDWLRSHQLADGSWGAAVPYRYHDRVICTLAAMTALARLGHAQDRVRWQRAQQALEMITPGPRTVPSDYPAGFEMIVPTLLSEARELGIIQGQGDGVLDRLADHRAARLVTLQGKRIDRFGTAAYSAEMAGPNGLELLDVDNLQEANGSVGHNPSATTYFALYAQRQDPAALSYLRSVVVNGGAPGFAPFDVLERAWVLWNLALIGPLDDELLSLCQPHLDFLQAAWHPGRGVGFAVDYTPKDSDDTSLTYTVLTHFGRTVDVEAVLHYEGSKHFCCFDVESHPSISSNIHVLSALRQAGFGAEHPSVIKIVRFLEHSRNSQSFWFDKWHVSPYYTTAHAVIACEGLVDWLVDDAIHWILSTQNSDGSWGYYTPTAEETAYCLQALVIWKQRGRQVPEDVLAQGTAWLAKHAEPPYPPLWIGKCLYCPELVVRSAILSALMLSEGI
jgi:halimadienyl-diphosphate synthase